MNTIRLPCGCLLQGGNLAIIKGKVEGDVKNMVACTDQHIPGAIPTCRGTNLDRIAAISDLTPR